MTTPYDRLASLSACYSPFAGASENQSCIQVWTHSLARTAGESETTAAKAQGYADGVGDSIMGKAKVCSKVP
jgi:hypothetical protein